MKVIKRDGTEVEFQREKIEIAISKANNSVKENERLSSEKIKTLSFDIEKKCSELNRAVSVEDIQDIVENSIMELGYFALAKNYITYRYQRAMNRSKSAVDAKILSIVDQCNEDIKQENSNKNPAIVSTQRDYIAGETSKDISDRLLLPPDIVRADKEGIIHFHDKDYYICREYNCCLLNLKDVLQNGTVISETMIETPHSFPTACNIATQVVAQVASSQYGGQSFSLAHLAPFVDISRKKIRKDVIEELKSCGLDVTTLLKKIDEIVEKRVREEIKRGVQTIQYQILTLLTTNGLSKGIGRCKIA